MYMFMCVIVHVHMGVYVHTCMNACGIQRFSSVVIPQDAVHFIFETSRSLIDLETGQ